MNLLRWIGGLFSGGGGSGRDLPIYVLSRRCNEPIAGQVDLYNELSLDEEEKGYFCRKVLHTSGESRCFDQVEVNIWFDSRKNLVEHEVVGGRWLSEEEYERELVRFNTPPDTDDDVLPTLADNNTAENDKAHHPSAGTPAADAASTDAPAADTRAAETETEDTSEQKPGGTAAS